MTRKTNKVNPQRLPTAADLIDHFGIPDEYKHLEAALRTPAGDALVQALAACAAEGFSQAKINDVAHEVVEFYSRSDHRCTTCLGWTSRDYKAGGMIEDGEFHLVVVCAKCQKMIALGRITPTMQRNLSAYTDSGMGW